jgi:hypothetical protein
VHAISAAAVFNARASITDHAARRCDRSRIEHVAAAKRFTFVNLLTRFKGQRLGGTVASVLRALNDSSNTADEYRKERGERKRSDQDKKREMSEVVRGGEEEWVGPSFVNRADLVDTASCMSEATAMPARHVYRRAEASAKADSTLVHKKSE